MAFTATLAELRAKFREYTGRRTTGQISDNSVDDRINDYYVNYFPADAKVDEFDDFFTQALSATDTGIYALAQNIDRLDDPVTINGREIILERDRERFFSEHHHHDHHNHFHHFSGSVTSLQVQFEDEQFITDPRLAIGTSNTARVLHDDFDYEVQSKSYSKETSEVALTGDDVPAGLFGAWSLRIDVDGDITVAAAAANGTGYATPRIALDALTSSDSESAYMGYVTVTKSDGAFTPDTTLLGAANVTATFTDGRFENRAEPVSALLYGQNLYVKPKPNDIYEFRALSIADRPTALSGDSDAPADVRWGLAIAIGAANVFLLENKETETVSELATLTKYLFDTIKEDKTKRIIGQVVQRSF